MKGVHRWPGKVRVSNSSKSALAGAGVGCGVGVAGGVGSVQATRKIIGRIRRIGFMGTPNLAHSWVASTAVATRWWFNGRFPPATMAPTQSITLPNLISKREVHKRKII
jgi:hypothetical protein